MLNQVFQNSLWYSLSSILLRASSIIFFPIFSHYLTEADYGILSITQGVVLWISTVASLGMRNTLVRFLNSEESAGNKPRILGNALIICAISIFLWGLFFMIFGELLLIPVLNEIDYYPYMYYSIVGMLSTYFVNIYRFYLKAENKGILSFWFDICFFSSNIFLNLFFVVLLGMDVVGLMYSTIICGVIFTMISMLKLIKSSVFIFDKVIFMKLVKYSLPLVPFVLLGMGIETISAIFLNKEVGKDAAGIFYIAITFASIFSTLKESIISAISPWFFKNYETKPEVAHKLIYHLIVAAAISCFLLSVFAFEILFLLSNNDGLIMGWKYIPIILVGYLLIFIGQLFNLPVYHKATENKLLIVGSLVGFVATFLFSYFFAERGLVAASLSKTFGYLLMTVFFIWMAIKVNFKVDFYRILRVLIVFIPLFFVNFLDFDYYIILFFKIVISLLLISYFFRLMMRNYIGVRRKYLNLMKGSNRW